MLRCFPLGGRQPTVTPGLRPQTGPLLLFPLTLSPSSSPSLTLSPPLLFSLSPSFSSHYLFFFFSSSALTLPFPASPYSLLSSSFYYFSSSSLLQLLLQSIVSYSFYSFFFYPFNSISLFLSNTPLINCQPCKKIQVSPSAFLRSPNPDTSQKRCKDKSFSSGSKTWVVLHSFCLNKKRQLQTYSLYVAKSAVNCHNVMPILC